MNICAVIMAGGSGSRLWPLSRAKLPKQFLPISQGNSTMLQSTFNRISSLNISSSITICNEEHRFFVAEQLREINKLDKILLEPEGRNTAPAIALAALVLNDDPLMLILSSDHDIKDETEFCNTVTKAIPLAESGKLVTFGIKPTNPHTGYGYIKKGAKNEVGFNVDKFEEKPNSSTACEYLSTGDYLWNSGMFLFKASTYLEELKLLRPDIYDHCKKAASALEHDIDFIRIENSIFKNCPSESVDYAIMQDTKKSVVVPMNIRWNDLGSWSSLWDVSKKDLNGNVLHGDIIAQNTSNSYIRSESQLVTSVGLENIVIVATKDAVMVASKDKVEEIKNLTENLKNNNRSEWELHREVHRPWGKYDSIDNGDGYQVKRITVKPGAKLSVQKHYHRAEHWIVVKGKAKVTNDNKTFILNENESTFIPLGSVHSLENPLTEPLELIEVQSGSYLGEDDIVRFSDIYGRVPK